MDSVVYPASDRTVLGLGPLDGIEVIMELFSFSRLAPQHEAPTQNTILTTDK